MQEDMKSYVFSKQNSSVIRSQSGSLNSENGAHSAVLSFVWYITPVLINTRDNTEYQMVGVSQRTEINNWGQKFVLWEEYDMVPKRAQYDPYLVSPLETGTPSPQSNHRYTFHLNLYKTYRTYYGSF